MRARLIKWRRLAVIIFLPAFVYPVSVCAQTRPALEQSIALPAGPVRLDSFSRQLLKQSGLIFSFNARQISPRRIISFPRRKERLDDLLLYLDEHYGLKNKVIGNHIILYHAMILEKEGPHPGEGRAKQATDPPRSEGQRQQVPEDNGVGLSLAGPIRPIGPGVPFLSDFICLPQLTRSPLLIPGENMKTETIPESFPVLPEKAAGDQGVPYLPGNEAKTPVAPSGGRAQTHPFTIYAGLAGNDVLYVNPRIRAGLDWVFLSAGWQTNFKVSGFSYGLGVSGNLSRRTRFQLSASSGVITKSYLMTRRSDSTLRIKSRLTDISLLMEKHLEKRWIVEFGPVLHFLKEDYSMTGGSLADSYLPVNTDTYNRFKNFRPLYAIRKSYNEETFSAKALWVGLQIGVFYRFW